MLSPLRGRRFNGRRRPGYAQVPAVAGFDSGRRAPTLGAASRPPQPARAARTAGRAFTTGALRLEQVMTAPDSNSWLSLLVQQQSLALLLATFGGMLVFMMVERPRPGQETAPLPVAHWLTNWFLAAFNYFVGLWLVLQLGSLHWARSLQPDTGLFDVLHPALALPLLLFLVEGAAYGLHRLYHSVPLLWRIHAVHHMDRELDVTTSHRHHTLEVLLNTLVLLPMFLLLGVPAVVLVLLSLLRVFVVLFNHSSIYLPR